MHWNSLIKSQKRNVPVFPSFPLLPSGPEGPKDPGAPGGHSSLGVTPGSMDRGPSLQVYVMEGTVEDTGVKTDESGTTGHTPVST